MFSENSKKKLSSTKMPRALRARQAFPAEFVLASCAENVDFALILIYVSDILLIRLRVHVLLLSGENKKEHCHVREVPGETT